MTATGLNCKYLANVMTRFFIKWANVADWKGKWRSTDVDFSDLCNSELLDAGPPSLYQLSLCSLKTRSLVWFPKLKPASDSESCGWLLIRIKDELCLLEAKIYNVTSEQPDSERPREANFTSVCNFQAIIPGRPLLRRNNWIELNTHLVRIWPEKCLLDYLSGETWRETEADLVHYFILKRLQVGCGSRRVPWDDGAR